MLEGKAAAGIVEGAAYQAIPAYERDQAGMSVIPLPIQSVDGGCTGICGR